MMRFFFPTKFNSNYLLTEYLRNARQCVKVLWETKREIRPKVGKMKPD